MKLPRLLLLSTLAFSLAAQHPAHAIVPATPPHRSLTAATTLTLTPLQDKVAQFGLAELAIQTDGTFANPFDPSQADLRAIFTSPKGKVVTMPAFWHQDFDAGMQPKGSGQWRARFTPTEAGEWKAQAELAQPKLTSTPIAIKVDAAQNKRGFVRIDKANPRGFAFDNGEPFVPIGLNIGWAEGEQGKATIEAYTRWFDGLSKNGGNMARIWMPAWGFGIEWRDTGLGNYSKRMDRAWLLDQIFKLAEQRGIYIMLTLVNHGQFSETTNSEWKDNPYNAANDGPLKTPGEFVTNAQAKQFFKQRLRYIAARWGYSPNLFAWEWWNEVNWTPIGDDTLRPWIKEMTPALLQHDPNDHLISTSYAAGSGSAIWDMPELDFAQQHDYSGSDPMQAFRSQMRGFMDTAPNKPVMMAEHGYSAAGADALEEEKIHLHNGIWAAPFSGFASSGMYWWWDKFIDPQNLWPEYKRLADFVKGETLAAYKPGRPQAPSTYDALALRTNERQLVWLRSKGYDAGARVNAKAKAQREAIRAKKPLGDWQYELPILSSQPFTVTGIADGAYTAQFYTPQAGAWLTETALTVTDGKGILTLPDFDRDIAIKVTPAKP